VKAIALLSGGLDSCLAASVVRDQGVDVEAFNFQMPFCQSGAQGTSCGNAMRIADLQGLNLRVVHLGAEFMEIVVRPKHGRGKNMNPCIDCRILMLRKAKERMADVGASFVITGEVLGQRPLSQHWRAMRTVERESGLDGLLVRPLCARLLPPTIPEIKGWLDRERLLAVQRRSRKEQIALARHYDLTDQPTPAGGCLLTDPAYSRRLRDVLDCGRELTVHLAQLIRHGRYFRLDPATFAVVGRNESDNGTLEGMQQQDEWLFRAANCMGPSAIGSGKVTAATKEKISALVARYSDKPEDGRVTVEVRRGRSGEPVVMSVETREPTLPATR
jgi:tRNA U34 2-thiouridine synthase MnmA/TrmU